MQKSRFPKLRSVFVIPIDLADLADADSNGLVVVKWKCKLNYQGHVYFEAV